MEYAVGRARAAVVCFEKIMAFGESLVLLDMQIFVIGT